MGEGFSAGFLEAAAGRMGTDCLEGGEKVRWKVGGQPGEGTPDGERGTSWH